MASSGDRIVALRIAWACAGLFWFSNGTFAQFTVTPVDERGADGVPDVVNVETPWYKFRFILWETGSADSMIYKPLRHELRSENYYGNHMNSFRDWVRLADPDPIEGHTRGISDLEIREQSRQWATYRIVRQDAHELVLEFETRCSTAGGQPWMDKILNRRRLFFRHDSPLVRVENEIVNTDAVERSVLFEVFNGVNLGRVQTCVAMPGLEGKITGVDSAEERASSAVFAPDVADAWIGGVNAQGLAAAFAFDWPDVDGMHVSMYKTVGSTYHVVMRRRTIAPQGSITFRYAFLPFTGFGTLDGMRGDLAGGVLVGQAANYLEDVASGELKPGASVPIRVFLAGGREREVRVHLRCARKEDGQVVLDEARTAVLQIARTFTLEGQLRLGPPGLYVLWVTAEGEGVRLTMEKPLEVGKTRLAYRAASPAGAKRGIRDGGIGLGPAKMNPQFKTLDPQFTTPHLPLVKNHVRGPVRAFFLTPADSTLGHVREIRQRSDLRADYFAITKIPLPKYELHQGELAEFRDQLRAADPQVLVTFGIDWTVGLKQKLASELWDRVREGMGAVIAVRELKADPLLQEAVAQAQAVPEPPWSSLAVGFPQRECYQLGRGRIVLIPCNWSLSRDEGRALLAGWTELQLGNRREAIPEWRWRGFEYSYAHLAEAIRWAAQRDAPLSIPAAELDERTVKVSVRNSGGPLASTLAVAVRSRRWEVRASVESSVQVPRGESRHEVQLPERPDGGPLVLEISLRDAGGKLLAFASAAASVPSPVAVRVLPQPAFQHADRPGTCTVEVSGRLSSGRLEVAVRDRFDRLVLLRREPLRLQDGSTRLQVSLEGIRPLGVYHEVTARVWSEDRPPRLLCESSADVFLLPAKPPFADRFMLGFWGATERDVLQLQGMLDTARKMGMELHSHSYDDRTLYATGGYKAAMANLSPKQRYAGRGEEAKLDSEKLIMEPPLMPSPEAVRATKARWQQEARGQFASGAWMLGLDDERRMSDDFDFHPQTLAGFRRWMAGRYANIAELNQSWGTAFAGFEQVMPKRRGELGDSENLAPWLEFRMFIGEVLGEYYMKAPAEWAREIHPGLSVAEWGIYEPSAAWPVDWSRYAGCYQYTSRYGGNQSVLEELFRCFAPGTRHGEWQGYGMMAISPERRIDPWRSLLNGGSFCWFWELRDPGSLNYAVLTSDQRPTDGYAALAQEEFPDLTGGIDRLILASRFTDDNIAVAYSYPSWLCDTSALAGRAKVILEELGYQHTFVDLGDVAKGRLEKEGYQLLVIQQASCISRDQMAGVRRFVERGGTLLCIGRVGARDLHGAPWPGGPLADALTGVHTARATPLGRSMEVHSGGQPRWLFVADKEISLEAGVRVLAEAEVDGRQVPVWTERSLGQGKVFWLNSTLEAHRRVQTGGAAGERSLAQSGPEAVRSAHWAIFDRMASDAGIRPRLRLLDAGRPVFDTETWYYQSPSGRSWFVAHYLARKIGSPLTVRFHRPAHVYEVRQRRYLGRRDAWQDTFLQGRMKIYALLDYRVKGAEANADPGPHRPGSTVKVHCHLETEGASADLHALRIQVLGPGNTTLRAHNSVALAPAGRAAISIPLALNQPAGRHTVLITDVISGMQAKAEFQVAGK
mgnify:CR=1 FL=1